MKASKIATSLILSALTLPAFANECIDNFDEHVLDDGVFFRSCQLTDNDLLPIVTYMNQHPDLHYISLSQNNISDQGLKTLALLQGKEKSILLDDNHITDAGMVSLTATPVAYLDLSGNAVHTAGIKTLLQNPALHRLVLHDTAIDNDIASIFSSAQLDMIDIGSDELSSDAWKTIGATTRQKFIAVEGKNLDDGFASGFSQNTTIETLLLSDSKISAEGYSLLLKNNHFKSLLLTSINNKAALMDAIAQSKSLESLYLFGNASSLLAEDGRKIAQNISLKALWISPNYKIDVGFANEIVKSASIHELSISDSQNDDAIAGALANGKNITDLMLSGGKIGDAGAIALSQMHSLETLELAENAISDAGALAFIDNDNLEMLDLRYNKISAAAVKKLQAESRIKELFLSDQYEKLVKDVKGRHFMMNYLRTKI